MPPAALFISSDTLAVTICALVLGACVGSFLNVAVWRWPRGMSVVAPASACPSCRRELRPWENVPVLAWVALQGRCASCAAPISVRYPLVEAGAALLWAVVAVLAGTAQLLSGLTVAWAASSAVVAGLIRLDGFQPPRKLWWWGVALVVTTGGLAILRGEPRGMQIGVVLLLSLGLQSTGRTVASFGAGAMTVIAALLLI